MMGSHDPYMIYTVNVERFAGLNICGFSPLKIFVGILSQCLSQQCLLFKYSWENFSGTLKHCESLAQSIFPR